MFFGKLREFRLCVSRPNYKHTSFLVQRNLNVITPRSLSFLLQFRRRCFRSNKNERKTKLNYKPARPDAPRFFGLKFLIIRKTGAVKVSERRFSRLGWEINEFRTKLTPNEWIHQPAHQVNIFKNEKNGFRFSAAFLNFFFFFFKYVRHSGNEKSFLRVALSTKLSGAHSPVHVRIWFGHIKFTDANIKFK